MSGIEIERVGTSVRLKVSMYGYWYYFHAECGSECMAEMLCRNADYAIGGHCGGREDQRQSVLRTDLRRELARERRRVAALRGLLKRQRKSKKDGAA